MEFYANGSKYTEHELNCVLGTTRSHTVLPHFKLLPLEGSALCWLTSSSVTSVCQYGQNCAELAWCQPVENLPPIDIHLRMDVVGNV